MDKPPKRSKRTIREIREAITGGLDPRDVGGGDARRGRPPPVDGYLPPFLHSCRTNAQELLTEAEEDANGEFGGEIAKVRQCPFALESPCEAMRATPPQVEKELLAHIEHNSVELSTAKKDAEDANAAYEHQLQAARAVKPPGGWKGFDAVLLVFVLVVLVDGGVAAALLAHALGKMRAIFTCIFLAICACLGGAGSAWFLLRPVDYRIDTPARRIRQWIFALMSAALTFLVLYIGACFRALWIEGLTGRPSEIVAKFQSPGLVLLNFDILVLAVLGVVGFVAGVWECTTYFRDYGRALREAGLGSEQAEAARKQVVARLTDFVRAKVAEAHERVEASRQETDSWVREMPGFRDEAAASATGANSCCNTVDRILSDVSAEYADGFHEVKVFDRKAATTIALQFASIAVPEAFDKACDAAGKAIQGAGAAANQAHADLDAVLVRMIQRINELAGLRPPTPGSPPLLPKELGP